MFAEIKLQLDEEKGAINKTDVVNQAEASRFEEVWNLSKPVEGRGGWLLAGIQQLQ